MATIKDLELAIERQFPKGVKTTLDKFQLAILIEYVRTLRNINNGALSAEKFLRINRRKIQNEIDRISLDGEGSDLKRNLALLAITVASIVASTKRSGIRIGREINRNVKSIGRVHRMRLNQVFDEFGFELKDRGPVIFNDPTSAYRKNLDVSEKIIKISTKRTFEKTKAKAKQITLAIESAAKTQEIPPSLKKDVSDLMKIQKNDTDRLIKTEGVSSSGAAASDTYDEWEVERCSWSAAFDSRTCPICTRLNGTIWKKDDPAKKFPIKDSHSRCRCTLLPIPTDELFLSESVRQGLNREGEKLSGQKWLETKPDDFVRDNLGSRKKMELFRKGLPLHKIVNRNGRILRDTELEAKYGDMSTDALHRIRRTLLPKKAILKKQKLPSK